MISFEVIVMQIVLASSSPYRKKVLQQLKIPFLCFSPNIDEKAQRNEQPIDLVARLAKEKALEGAKYHPNSLIIASDQIAILNNQVFGKPKNYDNAYKQLLKFQGKTVQFLTSICLLDNVTAHPETQVESFTVTFRPLAKPEIIRYLKYEKPYNCAGGCKIEGLGLTLIKKLQSEDPNTIIGLPLIRLISMLKKRNINLL